MTSLRNISCLTKIYFSQCCAMSECLLAFIHTIGYTCLPGRVTYAYKTYRATPTIKLLESRSARGSTGSVMRPQSWVMSAPMTSRFGSLLNEDLAPRVAASLQMALSTTGKVKKMWIYYHRRPKPLSRRESSSGVKNMLERGG